MCDDATESSARIIRGIPRRDPNSSEVPDNSGAAKSANIQEYPRSDCQFELLEGSWKDISALFRWLVDGSGGQNLLWRSQTIAAGVPMIAGGDACPGFALCF
jgi:hypothetical protein